MEIAIDFDIKKNNPCTSIVFEVNPDHVKNENKNKSAVIKKYESRSANHGLAVKYF